MTVDLIKAAQKIVVESTRQAITDVCDQMTNDIEEFVLRRDVDPPSDPGEPPALRTGNLARSQGFEPAKVDGTRITGRIFNSADYAVFLEIGTLNMQARPFFLPFISSGRNQRKYSEMCAKLVQAGLKRGAS